MNAREREQSERIIRLARIYTKAHAEWERDSTFVNRAKLDRAQAALMREAERAQGLVPKEGDD